MDRLLVFLPCKLWKVCTVVLLTCGINIITTPDAYAVTRTAIMTGYAFANPSNSASGISLVQGEHFANHPPGPLGIGCGYMDPAANWAWNTQITMVSPAVVYFPTPTYRYARSSFKLADNGDPTCSKGAYWADLYFGNWKRTNDTCWCDNFTYCYPDWSVYNSCEDAYSWGSSTRQYDGP